MKTSFAVAMAALIGLSATDALGLVDDIQTSQTQPAAALVGPFDVTEGHATFLSVSNLAEEEVVTHWVFWSDDCTHLVDVWICLTPRDTVVVDPRRFSSVDDQNDAVGPGVDLSGERGSIVVTAYEAGHGCRAPLAPVLVDDAIVGSFTVADTGTDAAFGGDLAGFGLDPLDLAVDLPDMELGQIDIQTFNPNTLGDTTVALLAFEESSDELRPLTGVTTSTIFFDTLEVPVSLPDVAVSCATIGSILETLLPPTISPNSSGIVRLLQPRTNAGPIGVDTWLIGFYGQSIGNYGSGSRGKYPVVEPTPVPTGSPVLPPTPTPLPTLMPPPSIVPSPSPTPFPLGSPVVPPTPTPGANATPVPTSPSVPTPTPSVTPRPSGSPSPLDTPTPTILPTPDATGTPIVPPSPSPTPTTVAFCGYTQGGWGAGCQGSNPGCLRDAQFPSAFPSGISIGGITASAEWTSSAAIEVYLPAGGPAAALTGHVADPTTTAAGVLGGQLVAAILSTTIGTVPPSYVLAPSCVPASVAGMSISDLIAAAQIAVDSGVLPSGATFSDLNDGLTQVNEGFDDCVSNGCLLAPSV